MITVFFRVTCGDLCPKNYVGLAAAKNGADLFWLIDEFIDPYSVEIAKASKAGVFFETKINEESGLTYPRRKRSETSASFLNAACGSLDWYKPEIVGYEIIIPWMKRGHKK